MRQFFVTETVQTSMMDCGPAALKAMAEGYGIHVSYGRLREACQTDVDGTSIDQIEAAAADLGLNASQVMVPVDHLLAAEIDLLPAVVVVRHSSGQTHFVVVWRRLGTWLQIMDPAVGRVWMHTGMFLQTVYCHEQAIDAASWREWASTESFLNPLRGRLRQVGVTDDLPISNALADAGGLALARLDAATRMVASLIKAGGLRRGAAAARVLLNLARSEDPIPDEYWSTRPHPSDSSRVLFRGAVLIQVTGRSGKITKNLSTGLEAALAGKPDRPTLEWMRLLYKDGIAQPAVVAASVTLASAGVIAEAMVFRALIDVGRDLSTSGQRIGAVGLLLGLSVLLLILDFTVTGGILRLGRRVEIYLRVEFLRKMTRLNDRYFHSRPISDMADRGHKVHHLRTAPDFAGHFLRIICEMVLTAAAIAWFYPETGPAAFSIAVLSLAIPIAAQPLLTERDLRRRNHSGALSRFYLDALLGLTAVKAHDAEKSLRREQERLLGDWARSGIAVQKVLVIVDAFQFTSALALTVYALWTRLQLGAEITGLVLLVYWLLNLPALGQEAASIAAQYPAQRNAALRLMEPLKAPEEKAVPQNLQTLRESGGVSIRFEGVTVRAAGQIILENLDLSIQPGSHVAIVGASGAGKSSLAGLLLGWHRPAAGRILIDGQVMDEVVLERLRRATAWVDPEVQVWNRSLFDNLRYGISDTSATMDDLLEKSDLSGVLKKLPEGFQTRLGEGGRLVSGGEGQRVRIGRAMARSQARLVILDEPARGLDRERRRAVLESAREHWRNATLLYITHDVADAGTFERVLLMHAGRILEDGAPCELAADSGSHYSRMLRAEDDVRRRLWSSSSWRRLTMRRGNIGRDSRKENHAEAVS